MLKLEAYRLLKILMQCLMIIRFKVCNMRCLAAISIKKTNAMKQQSWHCKYLFVEPLLLFILLRYLRCLPGGGGHQIRRDVWHFSTVVGLPKRLSTITPSLISFVNNTFDQISIFNQIYFLDIFIQEIFLRFENFEIWSFLLKKKKKKRFEVNPQKKKIKLSRTFKVENKIQEIWKKLTNCFFKFKLSKIPNLTWKETRRYFTIFESLVNLATLFNKATLRL